MRADTVFCRPECAAQQVVATYALKRAAELGRQAAEQRRQG
jgi:hypothetical protein